MNLAQQIISAEDYVQMTSPYNDTEEDIENILENIGNQIDTLRDSPIEWNSRIQDAILRLERAYDLFKRTKPRRIYLDALKKRIGHYRAVEMAYE